METTREDLFAVLVREHESGLRAFVSACVHDRGDAEDVLQLVFATAWRRLDDYDADRPFAAWLRGIARHKILAYFRSQRGRSRNLQVLSPEALAAIADEHERFAKPPRGEVYRDAFDALRTCLESLAQEDQLIIDAVYHGGLTCRAVAEQLGRGVEAVKKRLQRARAELRDCVLGKLEWEPADVR